MNGCLIIGTLDGANIEIRQEIGDDNMFIFGAKAHEVEPLRQKVRYVCRVILINHQREDFRG